MVEMFADTPQTVSISTMPDSLHRPASSLLRTQLPIYSTRRKWWLFLLYMLAGILPLDVALLFKFDRADLIATEA